MIPCLITSANPSCQIRSGKVSQRVDVCDDEHGMMEAADQIFPGAGIHAGLSANAAIDLGQQRCRARKHKEFRAGKSPRRSRRDRRALRRLTTPERTSDPDRPRPVVAERAGLRDRFRPFAGRDRDQFRTKSRVPQAIANFRSEERRDICIRNNRTTVAGKMAPNEWADLRQQARADEGFVAVLPGANFNRFHGSQQKWGGRQRDGLNPFQMS